MLRAAAACYLLCAFVSVLNAVELQLSQTIGKPIQEHEKGWQGHVDRVSWVDEKTIVSWSQGTELRCQDVQTKQIKWSVKNINEISGWTLHHSTRQLALLHEAIGAKKISIYDCNTGRRLRVIESDELARFFGVSSAWPNSIAYTPNDAQLVICCSENLFGRNAFLLDPTYKKVVSSFDVDASAKKLTLSPDGKTATVLAAKEVVCTRELKTNKERYFIGQRVFLDPGWTTLTIGPSFASHAYHDGDKTLITAIDGGCFGEGVFKFHNLETKGSKFYNAHEGHIEMDVDFAKKRIAITGTSTDLKLMDFDGQIVAKLPKVTEQRNIAVEFSPNGKRIAVGSWDNTVRIVEIKD